MAPQRSSTRSQGESYVCSSCGYSTNRATDFTRHSASHLNSQERAARSFLCPHLGCNYRSLQKSNLVTHTKIHAQVKDQRCPDCSFAASDPGSLTRHRKRLHDYQPLPRKKARQDASSSRSTSATSASPSRAVTAPPPHPSLPTLRSPAPIHAPPPPSLPTISSPPLIHAPHSMMFTSADKHVHVQNWKPFPALETSPASSAVILPSFQEAFGNHLFDTPRYGHGTTSQRFAPYPSTRVRYKPYYHHRVNTPIDGGNYDYSFSYTTTREYSNTDGYSTCSSRQDVIGVPHGS